MQRYKRIGVELTQVQLINTAVWAWRIALISLGLGILILVGYGVGFSVGFTQRFTAIETANRNLQTQNQNLQMNISMLNSQILEVIMSLHNVSSTLIEQGNFSWSFQNNCGNNPWGNGYVDPVPVQYNLSSVQMGTLNFTLLELAGPPKPEFQFQIDCVPALYVAFVMGNFVPIYQNPVLVQSDFSVFPYIYTVFASLANPNRFPVTASNIQLINVTSGCIQSGACTETMTSLPSFGPYYPDTLGYSLSGNFLTISGFILWQGGSVDHNTLSFQLSSPFRLMLPSA